MIRQRRSVRDLLNALVMVSTFFVASAAFGGSEAVGVLARSAGTTVSGMPAQSNTAIFAGDVLQVKDSGVAFVKLPQGGELVLDRGTIASLGKTSNSVNVQLQKGNLTVVHPAAGQALRVEAAGYSIEPAARQRAVGAVTASNEGLSVVTKEGLLHVQGPGVEAEATPSKPIVLAPARASSGEILPATAAASSHAGMIAGIGGGGAAAAAGAASLSSHGHSASGAETSTSVAGQHSNNGQAGSAPQGQPNNPPNGNGPPNGHNPIAIGQVGSHAPPQACENAASPSVPAVACGPGN